MISEELLARHKAATSQKEKAWIEWEYRRSMTPDECNAFGGEPGVWKHVVEVFDEPRPVLEIRRTLYRDGAKIEPIWDLLAKGETTIYGARDLVITARRLATKGKPLEQAVVEVVAEYLDRTVFRTLPGGKRTRVRTRRYIPRPDEQRRNKRGHHAHGDFWMKIRREAAGYIEGRLEGVDPIITHRLRQQFETDLNILLDGWSKKLALSVKAKKAGEELKAGVSRKRLIVACQTLGLDAPPPRIGITPKFVREARRRMHSLAQNYHPDSHGGSDVTIAQYHAVIEAFQTIERGTK